MGAQRIRALQNIPNFRFFGFLSRDLKLIFFSNFLGSFGDGLFAYLMPYYLTTSLNASPTEIGILYAVVNASAAVSLIVAGLLADRYDRKKILVLGWAVWVPAPLIFALAGNWVAMLPGMLLWGVWFGGPTTTAYIITTTSKEKLTLTFTALSAAWSLGYIFSPAIGGYLAGVVGMQFVFASTFVFYSLASIVLAFVKSQHSKDHAQGMLENHSKLQLIKSRKLLVFSLLLGLTMFTLLLFRPFIPRFLSGAYNYDSFQIGLLGSFAFLGSAVWAIVLGRIGDKYNKSYALASALGLIGFSLVTLLIFGGFQILLATHLLIGASYVTWSLMNAALGSFAPNVSRAFWIAIPQTVGMLGAIFAPYLGGVLYELAPSYPFILGASISIVLALLVYLRPLD